MGQRIAVQKQQGWPVAAMAQANLRAAGLDLGKRKAGHGFHELSYAGSAAVRRSPRNGQG